MPEEVRVPLGMDGLELYMKAGTNIDLGVATTGDIHSPKLQRATLTSTDGIVLRKLGGRSLAQMSIHSIEITPGGHFKFEYDLLPEHMLGLFGFFGRAAANGATPIGIADAARRTQIPRIEAAREEIDKRLQAEVPPRFHALLAENDHIVPATRCSICSVERGRLGDG